MVLYSICVSLFDIHKLASLRSFLLRVASLLGAQIVSIFVAQRVYSRLREIFMLCFAWHLLFLLCYFDLPLKF